MNGEVTLNIMCGREVGLSHKFLCKLPVIVIDNHSRMTKALSYVSIVPH